MLSYTSVFSYLILLLSLFIAEASGAFPRGGEVESYRDRVVGLVPKLTFRYTTHFFTVDQEEAVLPFGYFPVKRRVEKALALVLLPWEYRTELYPVLIDDLHNMGLSVVIVEWPRESLDAPLLPFSYDTYSSYLDEFIASLEKIYIFREKTIGIGLSLGGNVLLKYAHHNPGFFEMVIVSAPIFGVKAIPGIEQSFQEAIAKDFVREGRGDIQILGRKKWYPAQDYDATTLKAMNMTHDLNYAVAGYFPQKGRARLRRKGYTYQWLLEVLNFSKGFSHKFLSSIETPILMGIPTADSFSDPELQTDTCMAIPNCYFYNADGAYHNLLRESDRYRQGWMDTIREYLDENL